MKPALLELLSSPPQPSPLQGPLVVYGLGNKGKEIVTFLADAGYQIHSIIDAGAKPGQTWENISVLPLESWLVEHTAQDFEIVIAIHNPLVNLADIVSNLRNSGFKQVVTPITFYNLFPDTLTPHFWLTPSRYYRPFQPEIDALLNLFDEAESMHWLESILAFRLTGDYSLLPSPDMEHQYCPPDLRWEKHLRFIDCGAYVGDTLASLKDHGYEFAAIAAFEPDPNNFRVLARNAKAYSPAFCTCFPCGTGATTTMLRFSANQGAASHIAEEGELLIQSVMLDEALPSFAPNLIKLDVEGAEIDTLCGARAIIERHRPALAVSIYHQPAHLWEIPLMLASWNLGYRFLIRGHGQSGFDTVLYAIPTEQ